MAYVDPKATSIVAHMAGVREAVKAHAEDIASRARADLEAHRATGNAQIEVESENPDTLVSLVDPAALSIEYGRHANPETGHGAMEGLHILGRAADL